MEHHEHKINKPLEEHRKEMVHQAYKHYTLPEFKEWASDVCMELAQQIARINTEKFDKEDIIKSMLMVEDTCCILRMLMKKDEEMIESIATDVYCHFAEMLKAHGVVLESECSYNRPNKLTVQTNSLK